MVSIGDRMDGSAKDTLRNARDSGELVIQLVAAAQAEAMNASSAALSPGVSEFERCGIARLPSDLVRPPRVANAAVAFECQVAEIKPYPACAPTHHLLFATVLLAHVDDAVLADARHVDAGKLDLIGRLGGNHYTRTRDTFALTRPK